MEEAHIVEAQIFAPSNNYSMTPGPVSPTDENSKQKKRRVNRACVYCNRSHMSCDEERPCKRCVTRGIAHLCKDPDTVKRRGRKATYLMPETQGFGIPQPDNTSSSPVTNNDILIPSSMSSNSDIPSICSNTSTPTSTSSPNDHSPQNYSPSSLINYFLTSLDNIEKYWSWASVENMPQQLPQTQQQHNISMQSVHIKKELSSEDELVNSWRSTSKEPLSEEEAKDIKSFIKILRTRIPDEAEYIIRSLTQRRHKAIQLIREKFNVEVDWKLKTELVKNDIEATIQSYRKLLEPLASPTIMFDRAGVIHYVNPAYRVLTGFSYTLPTEKSEFAFFKYILSPEALRTHFHVIMKNFEHHQHDKLVNAHIQPSAVRIHSELSEKYMDGMLAINTKRDVFEMPFLFIGTFLPFVAPDPGIFVESHKDIHI